MAGVSSGKRKILIALFMAIVLFLGYGLFHDLQLDNMEDSVEEEKQVGPTVSRLSFYREISGDIWELRSEKAVKMSNSKIKGYSVDVEMTGKEGNLWTAWAPEAEYDEKDRSLSMEKAIGTGLMDKTVIDWKADIVFFNEKTGIWTFPEGITAESASLDLKGNWGEVVIEGKMKVSGDAEAIWYMNGDKQ